MFACLAFIALGGAVLGILYWRMLVLIDGQIDGALQRECSEMTAAYEKGGYERLRQTVADRASPSPDALRIYVLMGPDEAPTGNLAHWPASAPNPGAAADVQALRDAKSARVRTLNFPDGIRLLVGRTLSERNLFQDLVAELLLSVLAANLLLGAAAGTVLAFYARRRLGQINATTKDVLEGNLSGRIEVGEGGDEYDQIAQNINAMLDRI